MCDAPQNCGLRLTDPRFSANGREVVFRDAAGQLQVTTPSGTCVFCLSSHPLWNLDGTSPAFAPNGKTITYVHRGLWQVTPGSTSPRRLLNGPVTSAVWSQSHQLLVTRRGWVWTGRPTLAGVLSLRRVVRGGAPAASPTGGEFAYTRDGSVFTLRLAGHKITRIARGSAPTFSPNGRSLAYLNQHHQVTIRPLGHGRARTLTRLRGRSLDWQPITTATRKGCEAANGVVVAADSAATIRAAADTQQFHIGWNGCLTALGIPFHLNGGGDGNGYDLSLDRVALAGNYAALDFVFTDKYMDYTNTVNVYDLRSGALVRTGEVGCGFFDRCSLTSLTVNDEGFAAWHSVQTHRECPTAHLIHVLSHHQFVRRGRHARRAARLLDAVRGTLGVDAPPPRRHRCDLRRLLSHRHILRRGDRRRERLLLSRPHRRNRGLAWRVAGLLPPPGGLVRLTLALRSCQRTGHIHRDGPGGPGQRVDRANAWQRRLPQLEAVSCPASTLCAAEDASGDVFTSSDPADSAPSWTTTHLADTVFSIECPTAGLCLAGTLTRSGAAISTTTNPLGGVSAWTAHPVTDVVTSVGCAGTSLCVAADDEGVVTSSDPSDASATWSATGLPDNVDLVSCPATNLCLAAGGPDILSSTDPTGGSSTWTGGLVDDLPCDPCLAETLAAVDTHGAHTLDTAPEGSGTVIANLQFSGDTLTWTDGGTPRSAGLS